MRQQTYYGDDDDDPQKFAETLGVEYTDFGTEANSSDPRKTIRGVSGPRYGSGRILVASNPNQTNPPPQFVDRVENAGYVFLDERVTSEGRWIAVIETLAARKQHKNEAIRATFAGECDEKTDTDRRDERLFQLARQATAAIESFEQSRQTIETQGEKVYQDPGDAASMAAKARGDYRAARSALLGFECGLVTGDDDVEIAVENLLTRPAEAAKALESVRDMRPKASVIGEDATLTRTNPTDSNAQEAKALGDHAARLIGHVAIAENALEAFVADHPENR